MKNFLSLWLNAGAQITHGGQVQRPHQKGWYWGDSWGDQLSNEMEGLVPKYPREIQNVFSMKVDVYTARPQVYILNLTFKWTLITRVPVIELFVKKYNTVLTIWGILSACPNQDFSLCYPSVKNDAQTIQTRIQICQPTRRWEFDHSTLRN